MATMSLQAAYDQARSFLEVTKVEQAIGVAQHILEYFPENLEAHRILGEAYLAGRQFDQAEAAFSRVLHSDPENIPAHVGLGITYERQSKLDRAVSEFEQALEIRPDMPELRSQLLRLYTDVWGAESATLRLSRPGLARLYAKGHMLPQAIQEFRSVIDEQPDRFDAQVGLAEALWRDGQTELAAEICEEMLAERPDVLKANLLIGYIRQAAGDETGEPYWRFAQQLEPYQQVARALFDVMPDLPPPDLEIPVWNEQAWQERRSREDAERLARPQAALPAVAAAPALADDTDFFSGWGDEADGAPASPNPAPSSALDDDNDDFLANLLALSAPIDDGSGVEIDSSSGITPFSFDEGDDFTRAPAAPAPVAISDEPAVAPLSLADLGLSEDEIAELSGPAETPLAPAATSDALDLAPFSLADLGLTEEEIAQLNGPAEAAPASTPEPEPEPASDEPELAPFSLADLGLSAEEIAQLNSSAEDAPPAPADPSMLPFSLDDLGLSPQEIAELNAVASAQPPPAMPVFDDEFSFPVADAAAEPPAAEPPAGAQPAGVTGLEPFDWSAGEESDSAEGLGFDSDISGLQPFSLDDLDLSGPVDDYGMGGSSLPSSLQAFSIDDAPPPRPVPEQPLPSIEADDAADTGGYSWQQPVAKQRTDFLRSESSAEVAEGSIFSKLKQRASELPKEELPPLPPVSADDADVAGYFSNDTDDVSLHDDDAGITERFTSGFRLPKEEPRPGAPAAPQAAAEPELKPFSLEELGLSPEEIAALSAADAAPPKLAAPQAAEPELKPFSLEELGLSPEEIAALSAAEDPAAGAASAATGETIVPGWSEGEEPELTPFSLEDLGLSPDEIASLEGISSPPAAQQPAAIKDDIFDFDVAETPAAETPAINDGVVDVEPFSLDEFDFDTGDDTPAAETPAINDGVSDVEPFSFDDLGLGDDVAAPGGSNRELSLTDDELAGLDLGEFETLIGGPGAPAAGAGESEVITGDPALDRLIVLGQRQGFVDLTDIIGVVDDPEAEAERIEEIGWTLHRAGIEIRDGDEIIDMEEGETEPEYAEPVELVAPAGPASDIEPELTPFSLEELGLSPEEIAALGLSDEAQPVTPASTPSAAPAQAAEPELTPFSLEELGLSPEEIALLNGTSAPEPAPAAPPAPAAEPELKPFSLEELGLSPEEIAALNAAEEAAPAAEPELKPFSLEELGLSPEEIAALNAAEEAAPAPAADDPFSFDLVEEQPVEKAVRTAPRAEEPTPPPPSEDAGFVPEPLENLDSVWDAPAAPVAAAAAAAAPTPAPAAPAAREKPEQPARAAAPPPAAREKSEQPARVVLPPIGERERARPSERREPASRQHDERYARREPASRQPDERYARREPASRSGDDLYARREAARSRDERYARRDYGRPGQSARQSFGSFVPTGDEGLDEYLMQLEAEPDNHGLALALARLCAQTGRVDLMAYSYKQLIRESYGLDEIADEVQELIETVSDPATEQQLYRVLGDALSKQGRVRDAMAAYNHTFRGR